MNLTLGLGLSSAEAPSSSAEAPFVNNAQIVFGSGSFGGLSLGQETSQNPSANATAAPLATSANPNARTGTVYPSGASAGGMNWLWIGALVVGSGIVAIIIINR